MSTMPNPKNTDSTAPIAASSVRRAAGHPLDGEEAQPRATAAPAVSATSSAPR